MKLKSLILLMLLAAVGATAYFYSLNQNTQSLNANLVPDLAKNLNRISKFTVQEAGDSLLASVSKTDEEWVVDNRAGYPANVKAVRAVFEALAAAKLVEAKTANPANYVRLGVEDVSDKNAKGVLLQVEGLDKPVNIIFGNDGSSGKNTQYVRNIGEQQSWLINKKINFKRDTTDWLQKNLIDIPPERIKSIQILHPDGTVINIANTGNAAYEFEIDANAPAGMRISESEIYQVANALSSLQIRDVTTTSTLKKDDSESVQCKFKTFDGLTISTSTHMHQSEVAVEPYFSLEIEFNEQDVDQSIIALSDEDKNASDKAMTSNPDAAKELAEVMEAKLAGWGYLFPTITKDALTKKLEYFFIEKDT